MEQATMHQAAATAAPPGLATWDGFDLDALIAPYLEEAVAALDGPAPLLAGMVRYHLGEVDGALAPVVATAGQRGKRMRPLVAVLSAGAVGGAPFVAAPVAAAIELLHNFTLIHDDIQDQSPTRRHRLTVWNRWGIGQAINAGDALFAAAHLPFLRLREFAIPGDLILRLIEAFDRMTIAIVTGQTLDLGFEERDDVTLDDYLTMIDGKTAAIVRYAAWAGALLGGAEPAAAERFGEFGRALGLGFQVRDDLLGIWGETATTGKAPADDIRRRKQSLPIVLLRERSDAALRAELDRLYQQTEIDQAGVERVLALLHATDIQHTIERRIAALHDEARLALTSALPGSINQAGDRLFALVEQMASRAS